MCNYCNRLIAGVARVELPRGRVCPDADKLWTVQHLHSAAAFAAAYPVEETDDEQPTQNPAPYPNAQPVEHNPRVDHAGGLRGTTFTQRRGRAVHDAWADWPRPLATVAAR